MMSTSLTFEQLRSSLVLRNVQEIALSGEVTKKNSGRAEMDLDVSMTADLDNIKVTFRFTVTSPDMSLSTTQTGVWVTTKDELELSSEAVQIFVTDIALPIIFPYARASIDLIASRLGIKLSPLPHFDPRELEPVDSKILLDGAESIVLSASK